MPASERNSISRYESKYSPQKYVTATQYIIELICEKRAAFDHKELYIQFWKDKQWAYFFKKNLRKVHLLLKQYEPRVIINALQSQDFKFCYSIFTDKFSQLLEVEQAKLDLEKPVDGQTINRNTLNSTLRETKPVNNLLTRLDI
jgi:hypothetical protein